MVLFYLQFQYLTVMSVEVHASNRGDLRPDPEHDPVEAVFYSIFNDVPPEKGTRKETGVIIVDPASANQDESSSPGPSSAKKQKTGSPKPGTSAGPGSQKSTMTLLQRSGVLGVKVIYVKDEIELFHRFIAMVYR